VARPMTVDGVVVRIASVYPLSARKLGGFHERYTKDAPAGVAVQAINTDDVVLRGDAVKLGSASGTITLSTLPSDQVVATLALQFADVDLMADVPALSAAVRACALAEVTVVGQALTDALTEMVWAHGAEVIEPADLLLAPERHHLLLIGHPSGQKGFDTSAVLSLLDQLAAIDDAQLVHAPTKRPEDLNHGDTVAVVAPSWSVLAGHSDVVHNTAAFMAARVVGESVRLRQLRCETFMQLRHFRYDMYTPGGGSAQGP
jgi:hypothetical protein